MKKILTLLIIGFAFAGKSQDYHLVQYDAAPLYMNPALTGSYFDRTDAHFRAALDFRSQWKSILPKPFSTCYFSYDQKIDEKWAVGGYLINNRAVAGNYNSFHFLASGSYQITDTKKSPHHLSTGVQMGIMQLSFNNENFTYDTQYSGSYGGFDPGIPNGEPSQKNNLIKFDANMGVYYKYLDQNSDWKPFGGFAIYHITKPNESFTSYKRKIPMRLNFNVGTDYIIDEKWSVTPSILFNSQAKAYDLLFSALAKYHLKNSKNTTYDLLFGLNYHFKDAFALQAGVMKGNMYSLRLSYDINTSYLKRFTGGRGAFEVSLVIYGRKNENIFKAVSFF